LEDSNFHDKGLSLKSKKVIIPIAVAVIALITLIIGWDEIHNNKQYVNEIPKSINRLRNS
jgi:hypothetical protein